MASTKMARERIIELGRSGDPWGFMAIRAQALRIAPAEDAIFVRRDLYERQATRVHRLYRS